MIIRCYLINHMDITREIYGVYMMVSFFFHESNERTVTKSCMVCYEDVEREFVILETSLILCVIAV